MKTYKLTVIFEFQAYDDPHAREISKNLLVDVEQTEGDEIKLQEVFHDKPRRRVKI